MRMAEALGCAYDIKPGQMRQRRYGTDVSPTAQEQVSDARACRNATLNPRAGIRVKRLRPNVSPLHTFMAKDPGSAAPPGRDSMAMIEKLAGAQYAPHSQLWHHRVLSGIIHELSAGTIAQNQESRCDQNRRNLGEGR